MKSFYANHPEGDVGSVDALAVLVQNHYPGLNSADRESLNLIYERLKASEVNDAMILDYLEAHRDRSNASEVAKVALEVAGGSKTITDLVQFVQGLEIVSLTDHTSKFVPDNLKALMEWDQQEPGLRWRLNCLNRMLGSIRQGNFGLLFARVESGKSAFLCSEVSYMAQQTDKPVLYFNNEQPGREMQLRLYSAVLGKTLKEIYADWEQSERNYRSLVGDRIKLFDSAHIHRREVETLCKDLGPGLVVFDQLDKIKGFKASDRKVQQLGDIYQWSREIAKDTCPVIGVCQAAASAENKRWLDMNDIDESKVSKPAELDFIVGMGKMNDEAGLDNIRFLHACKNKLHGDPDSRPEERHGRAEVKLQPELSRVVDLDY